MTGMDELVTWLRAQLDEDERVARESAKPQVYWYMDGHSPEAYTHLTRWDPARVLAEVDAKRQRIAWLAGLEHEPGPETFPTWESCRLRWTEDMAGDEPIGYCTCGLDAWRNQLYRFDALPYVGQPGYREEWRPNDHG